MSEIAVTSSRTCRSLISRATHPQHQRPRVAGNRGICGAVRRRVHHHINQGSVFEVLRWEFRARRRTWHSIGCDDRLEARPPSLVPPPTSRCIYLSSTRTHQGRGRRSRSLRGEHDGSQLRCCGSPRRDTGSIPGQGSLALSLIHIPAFPECSHCATRAVSVRIPDGCTALLLDRPRAAAVSGRRGSSATVEARAPGVLTRS